MQAESSKARVFEHGKTLMREVDVSDPLEPVSSGPGDVTTVASYEQLLRELQVLRTEHERIRKQQKEMMDLLGTASPELLLHDLRNVLNERTLYRTLVEAADDAGEDR